MTNKERIAYLVNQDNFLTYISNFDRQPIQIAIADTLINRTIALGIVPDADVPNTLATAANDVRPVLESQRKQNVAKLVQTKRANRKTTVPTVEIRATLAQGFPFRFYHALAVDSTETKQFITDVNLID